MSKEILRKSMTLLKAIVLFYNEKMFMIVEKNHVTNMNMITRVVNKETVCVSMSFLFTRGCVGMMRTTVKGQ